MPMGPLRTIVYVSVTSLCAILAVFITACGSILLTLFLQVVLAAILHVISTIGEIGIATVSAITSGFTISLTVVLAASTSAVVFPPTHIEARLAISVAVATMSIATSALALYLMTPLQLNVDLTVAVVTTAAVSVAFASAWAVGVMSLIERETHHVGLRMTSLLQAVRHNQYHVLSLLVRLPVGCQTEEITTSLLYAVKAGYVSCVRVLLSAGADPNAQDAYENTPLICACQLGCLTTVRLVLDAGAVVDFRNNNGETALHHCAKWGHVEPARLLLSNGADPNVQDHLGRTPLMLTVRHAQNPLEIMRMLIEAGSNVNTLASDHRSVLHYTAIRGLGVNDLINASIDLELQDVEGNTPLHLAAREGHDDVTQALLQAATNSNSTNYARRTPIHLAAAQGHLSTIIALIRHGADPIALDGAGYLPITHAVQNNRSSIIMSFLRHNYFPGSSHASSSVSTPNTLVTPVINPVRVALQRNYFHLARLLVLGGCDPSPLRSPDLMAERRIFHDDAQMLHFVWLHRCLQQPWPLLERCRVVIRHQLTQPMTDIDQLPIPKQLRLFVSLCDLEDIS